jgi:hypothetical protein
MRKIVVTEFLSLDGVMENPAWTFPYWNDEIAAFKTEERNTSDTLLLGRVTYQEFAASWPKIKPEKDPFAPYMNNIRKYVVSTTLKEPLEWNNSELKAILSKKLTNSSSRMARTSRFTAVLRWRKRSCNMIWWILCGCCSIRWWWARQTPVQRRHHRHLQTGGSEITQRRCRGTHL